MQWRAATFILILCANLLILTAIQCFILFVNNLKIFSAALHQVFEAHNMITTQSNGMEIKF